MGPAWQPTRLSNPNFYIMDKVFRVERRLGTRGWNIDPIVDHLNQHSSEFVCDTFVNESELLTRPVDIVFICKTFDHISLDSLVELKRRGVKLIYSIVDNSRYEAKCYLDHPEYMELFDHLLLVSSVQEQDVVHYEKPFSYLPSLIVNTKYKTDYQQNDPLRLVWNGVPENLDPMKPLFQLVKDVSHEIGIPMEVVINTNLPALREDGVHVVPWSIETWEDVMITSDIGIVIKPRDDFFQSRKPPTKVITYMAAGLPTICTPTVADESVIRHGETAYAAYSDEDWRRYVTELAASAERRRRMGVAARESVITRFSISEVAREHESVFRSVLQ